MNETDDELSFKLDVSDAIKNGLKGVIKADFKSFDEVFDTSIAEFLEMAGMTDKALRYLLPGKDGKKYLLTLDWTDENNVIMVVYDTVDEGLTVAEKLVSAHLDMTDFGSESYGDLFDANVSLGYASKATEFAYET